MSLFLKSIFIILSALFFRLLLFSLSVLELWTFFLFSPLITSIILAFTISLSFEKIGHSSYIALNLMVYPIYLVYSLEPPLLSYQILFNAYCCYLYCCSILSLYYLISVTVSIFSVIVLAFLLF